MEVLPLDKIPTATRMKILRLVSGVSVEGMAARWGRSRAYVYRIEDGTREPLPLEARDAMELAAAAITALDAGAGARQEARAALAAGERVALDAEAAAQRGREKDDPKRRRSAG